MKSFFRTAVVLTLLGLAAGCNTTGDDRGNRKLRVVTTTGMITDVVQVVGGEHVEVTGLMGPGVDPHLYHATPKDSVAMERADVIFYNGLHLEGQMGEVFEHMARRTRTVAVTEKLDREKDVRPAPPGYEGTHDPHVWFDVRLWMKAVECVRDTLAEMDAAHADAYRANAGRYLEELTKLDAEVKAKAETVPLNQRVLITAHDAFYYFGHAYGFEVHGLQGVSTASEASPADVQRLAQLIAERKVPAIFVESSVNARNIEAVQAAVRARGFSARIGGNLYSDAMGNPGTPEGTYVGMVRHNIDTIVGALKK